MPGETMGITPEEQLVHPDDYKDSESGLTKEDAALLAGAFRDPRVAAAKAEYDNHIDTEDLREPNTNVVKRLQADNAEKGAIKPEIRSIVGETFPNAEDTTKMVLAYKATKAILDERQALLVAKMEAEKSDEKAANELLDNIMGIPKR